MEPKKTKTVQTFFGTGIVYTHSDSKLVTLLCKLKVNAKLIYI